MQRVRQGLTHNSRLKRNLRLQMTAPESRLWSRLRAKQFHGLKFRRQHGVGPYVVDFYCSERSLVIEIDGDTHAEASQVTRDKERDLYLTSLGLDIVRYANGDVIDNLEGVLADLEGKVVPDSTSPTPPYKGGAGK